VAFIHDSSPPGSLERTTVAEDAIDRVRHRVAQDGAALAADVVPFDTHGDQDAAVDVADQIAADPLYVAAFAAPGLSGQSRLVATLAGSGVPPSACPQRDAVEGQPPGRGSASWRRYVLRPGRLPRRRRPAPPGAACA
jgi:hypothetical protein